MGTHKFERILKNTLKAQQLITTGMLDLDFNGRHSAKLSGNEFEQAFRAEAREVISRLNRLVEGGRQYIQSGKSANVRIALRKLKGTGD